ncbi:MAG: hypothetical protein ACHQF0_05455 [Chitinophagales bacterium]
MKSLTFFLFILLCPFALAAQTIHGVWSGTLVNDSTHHTQNFELGLSEYRGKITGYTYTTFIDNDTFYYSIKRIKAERKDGKIVITDDEMVGNNFPERAAKHVKQTTIFLLINDSTIDIANGKWSTNPTKKYYSIGGSATIREQDDEKKSDLLAHLQEANIKTDIAVNQKNNENKEIAKNSSSTGSQKNNNPAVSENKNTDVVKNSEVQSSKIKSTSKNNTQRNDAVNLPDKEKKEVTASGEINEDKEPETKNTTQKSNIGDHTISENPDQSNTKKDQSVALTKPVVQKDTTAQVVQKEKQPADKNSEKQKPNSIASINTPVSQKKDGIEDSKEKELKTTAVTKSTAITGNNNTGSSDKTKTAKDQLISQTKSPVKKDTVVQSVQKKDQAPDKNPENQKSIESVSIKTPASQKKDVIEGSKDLPAVVATRKNDHMQDVYFKNDSLVLSLYDNGIVDGDTVSVFLNGETIISKQMLKAVATKKTIYISEKMDSVQLVLFAENLGTIPPNTGLLTIRDGEDIYQVRFSADLQRNASIIFRRKK